jgi:hypothetical protein
MSQPPTVKPTHKPVKQYYEALAGFAAQGVGHEMAVRSAFQHLLEDTGRKAGWTLIPELSVEGRKGTVRPDGTFRDDFQMRPGYSGRSHCARRPATDEHMVGNAHRT